METSPSRSAFSQEVQWLIMVYLLLLCCSQTSGTALQRCFEQIEAGVCYQTAGMVMALAGLLAACIVVFVPLGMAGWHLTRNRVLFFSAMLFIVLAVAVHILPHVPAFSVVFSSVHSTVSGIFQPLSAQFSPDSCLPYLYNIEWQRNASADDANVTVKWSWRNSALGGCNFEELNRDSALEFLGGAWIMVAGDSQARFFLVSLLQLLLENVEPVKSKLFKYHSNYEYMLEEQQLKLDFKWAPYTDNLTNLVQELHQNKSYPDLIIMGAGLWHMLHVTNSSDYGNSLALLHRSLLSMEQGFPVPHMFWLNLPALVPSFLNTEAKRQRMTSDVVAAYERELLRSNLTLPIGTFRLLDMKRLTHSCGPECTSDGMHYDGAVYAAITQVMLQTLVVLRS